MAIVANVVNGELQYNYTDSSKKNEAVGSDLGYEDFLTLLCAEMQYQDPLEPTSNTDFVAQLASFTQVEALYSMADTQMNTMANALVGKYVILKVVSETTGAVSYVDGKVDYVMYENGETMLSVNNGLYPLSSLDTVADPDYYEAMGIAKTFSAMVALLPDEANLSTMYKGAIQEVREVYDSMTSYQQGFVNPSDLITLQELEARLEELLAAEKALEEANGEGDSAEADGSAGADDGGVEEA